MSASIASAAARRPLRIRCSTPLALDLDTPEDLAAAARLLDPVFDRQVWAEIGDAKEEIVLGTKRVKTRAYCSWFGFRGPDQQKLVANLSGGERNRLHLAKLLKQGANVLLLDEPSNDLDVETLRALDDLVTQGKVRYIGVSTWPAWLTVEAIHISERLGLNRFVSEQPPYNFLDRRAENTIIPMCQRYGLAVLPWSPLAGGILTGKYNEGIPKGTRAERDGYGWIRERITPDRIAIVDMLASVARGLGLTTAQLAIAWVLRNKGVTSALMGASKVAHIEDILGVANSAPISSEELAAIEGTLAG